MIYLATNYVRLHFFEYTSKEKINNKTNIIDVSHFLAARQLFGYGKRRHNRIWVAHSSLLPRSSACAAAITFSKPPAQLEQAEAVVVVVVVVTHLFESGRSKALLRLRTQSRRTYLCETTSSSSRTERSSPARAWMVLSVYRFVLLRVDLNVVKCVKRTVTVFCNNIS